jgi:hypothetical protein
MIKIHFINKETLEVECKFNDIIETLKRLEETHRQSQYNIVCLNNKYLFDLKQINYIEEV